MKGSYFVSDNDLQVLSLKDEILYLKGQLEEKEEIIVELKNELKDLRLELREAQDDRRA